jgi:predicted small secreted protein
MFNTKVSLVLLVFLSSFLAGCNTIEGAGQDIEAGGEKLQEAAENVKEKM